MEVPAAETTVDFSVFITDTKISPTVLTIEIPGTTGGNEETTCTFKMSVNGQEANGGSDLTALFTTSWVFDATTLSLSLGSRSTAFKFTGATSTEITIPAEHTHVTVNGVETYVNLPEIVTTIEVTESTNVIVDLPEVTTTLEIPAETFELTVTPFTITTGDEASGQNTGSSYCGPLEISAGAAYSGDTNTACVPAFTTTITLPSAAPSTQLYLYASGLQTAFTLPGITTTFIPEQTSLKIPRFLLFFFHCSLNVVSIREPNMIDSLRYNSITLEN